jgi:two-component system chemotaxis sensor kinase CheA
MKIDLSHFRETFMQESAEHVASMETLLLALRSAPGDIETLNAIFRSAHSIKGGAGSFGLTSLVRFTHALENLLDRLRALEIPVTGEIISVLLRSVDVLRGMLSSGEPDAAPEGMAGLVEQLHAFTTTSAAASPPPPQAQSQAESGPGLKVYRVDLRPSRETFSSGTNPIVLLRNLAALGTVSVCQLHTDLLPPLSGLDPGQCYLHWTVEIATSHAESDLREVFEFVEHLVELDIQELGVQMPGVETAAAGPSSSQSEAAPAAIALQDPLRTAVAPAPPAPLAAAAGRPAARKAAAAAESSSIRVSTDKVDRLIDLVGELVIAHVMAAQMVETFTPECLPRLRDAVAAMERNTRELHERVMSVRMLPIGTLFQRYTRVVYDIAQSTGKQIRLETDGEETEIDKSMLELLGDPLTHLIRNAADHGIEAPELRARAGKPEEGLIHLRAFHRSGRVVIEITDDGAGIDTARVRAKAIERGLIAPEAQLSEEQLRMLIFEPGFSTREQVSDLSGRGVGMDVVKRNVQQLSGSVALASQLGSGSTVSIELPLTLAILEGLLVRVADRTLVLPLLAVVETVAPSMGKIVRVAEQGEVIVIREESIPVLRLCRFLRLQRDASDPNVAEPVALNGTDPCAGQEERRLVVVVETGRKKVGLVVDELLGQQQVVVKSLEKNLHRVEGLMGATILGDGCVAPILDVTALAAMDLFSVQPPARSATRTGRSAVPAQKALSAPAERRESFHELV